MPVYRPRDAEHSVLHQVIAQHLEAFLSAVAESGAGAGLPQFVEREFREFLLCGVYEAGVARFQCRGHASGCSSIPGRKTRCGRSPRCCRGAVEELLRWWTPVMTFRRTAASTCRLGGVEIRGGDKVVVSFTSANRDEAVFTDPDGLDIRRHPNPHLAFGHGPHFFLGAHLARVQMRALFAEVLTAMGRLDYDGQPAYLRSNFQRGVKRLPVRWSRARR